VYTAKDVQSLLKVSVLDAVQILCAKFHNALKERKLSFVSIAKNFRVNYIIIELKRISNGWIF
jgi:hypothetical protein